MIVGGLGLHYSVYVIPMQAITRKRNKFTALHEGHSSMFLNDFLNASASERS